MLVDMQSNVTKILVTSKPGSEEKTVFETGDILFIHDSLVEIERTRFPGTIIVYTRLPPTKAYRLLVGRTTSYILRIVPDFGFKKSVLITQQISPKKMYIRCETRGTTKEICKETNKILMNIEGIEITTKKKSEIVFHIETVHEQKFFSVMPKDCDSISKIIGDIQLKRSCLEFMRKIEKMVGGGAPHGSGGWI